MSGRVRRRSSIGMLNRASFRSVLALSALALPGCMDDTSTIVPVPDPRLDDAAERTLAEGPAHLTATVRAGRVRYRLDGRWDPTRGYRVCAAIEQAPLSYFAGRVVWLEGREQRLRDAHRTRARVPSKQLLVRRPSAHPQAVRHQAAPRRRAHRCGGLPARRAARARRGVEPGSADRDERALRPLQMPPRRDRLPRLRPRPAASATRTAGLCGRCYANSARAPSR